jgi:hypothetical protein
MMQVNYFHLTLNRKPLTSCVFLKIPRAFHSRLVRARRPYTPGRVERTGGDVRVGSIPAPGDPWDPHDGEAGAGAGAGAGDGLGPPTRRTLNPY